MTSTISDNLTRVRDEISRTAVAAGRKPESVKLIAVSKTIAPEHLSEAALAGQVRFGENRVQEAAAKMPFLSGIKEPLEWHFVGHLQSNKARRAAMLFDWVHSIDSLRVLGKLNEGTQAAGRQLSALIQVDLSGEKTKSGIPQKELEEMLSRASEYRHVTVRGLMIIPPYFEDPEDVRPYFRKLREIRNSLATQGFPRVVLEELSMGMTHDYRVAIQEGSTMVRVGTAIFGPRA